MTDSSSANDGNYPGLSSPLMGEDGGRGGYLWILYVPLTLALSLQGRGDNGVIFNVIPKLDDLIFETVLFLRLEF